jgi:DhnA family fructose-bisphosphate aldolase class Ia
MTDKTNLKHFFHPATNRTVMIPIDHGTLLPVPGLEDTGALIEALKPYCDGFIVNLGVARAFAKELSGKGVVLRTDTGNTCIENSNADGSFRIYGIEDAKAVGAHALMNMTFPGHPRESTNIMDCADLISECLNEPHPIMLESLPYGLGKGWDYTPEKIHFSMRLACELGADVVKTAYPGDKEAFKRTVDEAYVPVVILGGASSGDQESVLRDVADAISVGAAGIAVGRNVWQAPDPVKMAKAMHAIVHENASADQASLALR